MRLNAQKSGAAGGTTLEFLVIDDNKLSAQISGSDGGGGGMISTQLLAIDDSVEVSLLIEKEVFLRCDVIKIITGTIFLGSQSA